MSLSAQQRALYTIVDPRPVFLTFPWTNTRITNYHSINATRPRALWNHAIPCHILICEADLCLPDFKQTFRKFISSLPFGGFQLMTFTYPHAWLSICLRWMSNGTGFLKRLSFSQMYNFLSLFCLKHFNWNMATFPNKCVFNSSRLHKPIAIIQIESLIFHVFCCILRWIWIIWNLDPSL